MSRKPAKHRAFQEVEPDETSSDDPDQSASLSQRSHISSGQDGRSKSGFRYISLTRDDSSSSYSNDSDVSGVVKHSPVYMYSSTPAPDPKKTKLPMSPPTSPRKENQSPNKLKLNVSPIRKRRRPSKATRTSTTNNPARSKPSGSSRQQKKPLESNVRELRSPSREPRSPLASPSRESPQRAPVTAPSSSNKPPSGSKKHSTALPVKHHTDSKRTQEKLPERTRLQSKSPKKQLPAVTEESLEDSSNTSKKRKLYNPSLTRTFTESPPSHVQTSVENRAVPKISSQTSKRSRKATAPLNQKQRVLKEIRKSQNSTGLLIRKLPFSRLVREICLTFTPNMRWQGTALEALQEAAEMFLVQRFALAYYCALHAKRVTLKPSDMQLISFIQGESGLGKY